jgi:lysophospholipase L1-like esterase
MKIAFFGDSITEGVGASNLELRYASQVGKMLGAEVINYGIGGTRLARQLIQSSSSHAHDIDFNMRTILLDKTADKIFFFGGTNDYGHGVAPLGNVGDYDEFTFHGAVNKLFSTLIGMYGKDKIVIILPLKRYGMNDIPNAKTGKYLVDYVEIIKYYVDLYGLKYLDLFNDCFDEPTTNEYSEFFADGLHPNDNGHKIIAEKICEFIKNDK